MVNEKTCDCGSVADWAEVGSTWICVACRDRDVLKNISRFKEVLMQMERIESSLRMFKADTGSISGLLAKLKDEIRKIDAKEGGTEANRKLISIFEYALTQEETGKSFYQASIQRMGIGAAVNAFARLIQEEEQHILFIERILDSLRRGNPDQLEIEEWHDLDSNYFDERVKSEFLQERLYESMTPDISVFSVACLIEKDLGEFYEKMAAQTEGKTREALLMLARWEKEHERFFMECRDKLTEIYSRMPWAG